MNTALHLAVTTLAAAICCCAAQAAPSEPDGARVDVVGQLSLRAACPSVDAAALADDLADAWSAAGKPSTVAVDFKVQGHHVYDVLPRTDSARTFHHIRHAVHQLACSSGDDQPHAVRFVIRFVDGERDTPVVALRDDDTGALTMAAPARDAAASWDTEIRAREEALRVAFLNADIRSLDDLMADDYIVNSPLHKVLAKPLLLQLLETGRLRHLSFESRIETMQRHGDTVVVMGGDRVVDGPDRVCSTRRFTNVWQLKDGRWRSTARHAHVVSREDPEAPSLERVGAPARERPGAPERAYQPTP